ncbi:vacuolar protein-sorting-associated protein 4 [Strigomonas culicis]|uniref:Vacuolar protein-sorting-associated protein 4 n=1 Tax=Strigomonas culicis TaxID=28005 RepID=S9V0K8_9TRYP|nr:vacuolar protein-sorting-associated protein 4 [Strigomonas culicis]EPY23950.1 vacuolar protein-sorting-associated protein 4 [Strigomonas culicis]|eukprot:EPY20451.1 vacuolar protein-sorting-associated protein 4 [Strigomonas culicis]
MSTRLQVHFFFFFVSVVPSKWAAAGLSVFLHFCRSYVLPSVSPTCSEKTTRTTTHLYFSGIPLYAAMQFKKAEEALAITDTLLCLLFQYPHVATAPLSVTRQIQSGCGELLSCLSILHSFELGQKPPCATSTDRTCPVFKRGSIYELVSKTLSQVMEFNTHETNAATDHGAKEDSKQQQSPPRAPLQRRVHPRASHRKRKRKQDNVLRVMPSRVGHHETFDAICGCEEVIELLKQCILLPSRLPFLFRGPRRSPQRILLYGPPGTGKTLLVTAAAQSTDPPCALLCVSASQLLSKWVGESEKQLEKIFHQAKKLAHQQGGDRPVSAAGSKRRRCIIFFDEIDALCGARGHQGETELSRRIKTEFLLHLNRIQTEGILVMAATNLPWEIDSAIRRRFDRFVYVDLPSPRARLAILRQYLSDPSIAHCLSPQEVQRIIHLTHRFSSADLVNVIQQAFLKPLAPLLHCTHLRPATSDDWRAYGGSPSLQALLTDARPVVLDPKRRRAAEAPGAAPAERPRPTPGREDLTLEDCRIPAHVKNRSQFDTWYVPCAPCDAAASLDVGRPFPLQELGSDHSATQVTEEQILVPPLRCAHFVEVLWDFIPSVTEHELEKFKHWGSQTFRNGM